MNTLVSYVFAAISGVCFIKGLVILADGRRR